MSRHNGSEPERCYHCAEAVPPGASFSAELDGVSHAMCCPGCKAVAEFIAGAGLTGFYQYRTAAAQKPDEALTDRAHWQPFDRAALQAKILTVHEPGRHEAVFYLEGIRCAACTWLIEQSLKEMPGVLSCEANPATAKAVFSWNPGKLQLSQILERLARLGFQPHAVMDSGIAGKTRREKRSALKRLAVAGLGMMQVLMFAVALYAGAHDSMDISTRDFLRLASLIVTTPVVVYSAWPFFAGAARDLAIRRAGMDVPVALAVGGAFLASLWFTLSGGAEVYFDSVTMFVFLLSGARYLEMIARHRASDTADALQNLLPQTVRLLDDKHGEQILPLTEIGPGDRLLLRPGDIVPADGRVSWGESSVDDSMLTGEFKPRTVSSGDSLTGGALNLSGVLHLRVEKIGADTALSAIGRLIHRAQASKPELSRLTDRVAGWFVTGVLAISALTAFFWWQADPARAFPITLSVLVVTCPCALSLATPTAFTVIMDALARSGILVTRGTALETLARVDRMVLDKTGTLTHGRFTLLSTEAADRINEDMALRIAASLESGSEHPLAEPFRPWFDGGLCDEHKVMPGQGIEGRLGGRRLRIGRPEFAAGLYSERLRGPDTSDEKHETVAIELADENGLLARFTLGDSLREDASGALEELVRYGIKLEIASGDRQGAVQKVAATLAVGQARGGLTPADKMKLLRARQADHEVVGMVGDGINDAPVLAAADVSLAMGGGTVLVHASADILILADRLTAIPEAILAARQAMRVVRQNLAWALGYNLLALPLAIGGMVQPWMAAIGMSLSSILVVANSSRLARAGRANIRT